MKFFKHIIATSLLSGLLVSAVFAQEPPKRELRATWLATVDKIDWPKTATPNTQKKEMLDILEYLEITNMNSVFFQVRPMADALYKSNYEPWSHYLTGTRGKDPGYDPLAFVIEEAHKKGIEVHAWMNPYRYEAGKVNHGNDDNIRKNHPEWLLKYSDRVILDPGNPEVRQYITDVVKDIIENYNVDGIIFDDYYYPYSGTTNQDKDSQDKYKDPLMDVGDWRRDNVNRLIAGIYEMIQTTKSTVKFSQGPFGIWGANATVAKEYGIDYLNTSGGTNAYKDIYCDAVRWIKDKTVDFITPQCYWPSTNTNTWGYTTLVPWWSKVAKTMDRHFYSSMRMSTMGKSTILRSANVESEKFAGLSHLERSMVIISEDETISLRSAATDECDYEIDLNRSADQLGAPGHVFFNTLAFFSAGFHTHLKEGRFSLPALTPTMTWKPQRTFASLSNIDLTNNVLNWNGDTKETDRFAIYLIPNDKLDDPNAYTTSTYLKKITWSKSFDATQYASQLNTHKFAITIVDAAGYESSPYKQDLSTIIESETYKDFIVEGDKGVIRIVRTSETPININIYSILGQKIQSFELDSSIEIPVNEGVYIVNGEKVIVQ